MEGVNVINQNDTTPFSNVRTTTELMRRINSDDVEGNQVLLYVFGGYAILCVLCVIIYAVHLKRKDRNVLKTDANV